MRMITLEDARVAAREAVDLKGPDYVYDRGNNVDCVYVDYDWSYDIRREDDMIDPDSLAPSCLVGHMLVNSWGVSPEEFVDVNESCHHQGVMNYSDIIEVSSRLTSIGFTSEALTYMSELQDRQDSKVPWGEALTLAEEFFS